MEYQATGYGHAPLAWANLFLIVVTCIFSAFGFKSESFERRYIFSPRLILGAKDYYRLFTSAFLHADGRHLLFNMISLYLFGSNIEMFLGAPQFLIIYFASVLGGSLLSLWLHKHHEYEAYGASGGVCGVIFAHIIMFPDSGVGAFFIPIYIPGWAYAIGFLLISFFALKAKVDNVGHDAHLGGAIIGLLAMAALHPTVVIESPKLFAVLLILSSGLFLYLAKNPMFLPLSSFTPQFVRGGRKKKAAGGDKRREVDRVLEKISAKGLHSLSDAERQLLAQMSDTLKNREVSSGRESDLVI